MQPKHLSTPAPPNPPPAPSTPSLLLLHQHPPYSFSPNPSVLILLRHSSFFCSSHPSLLLLPKHPTYFRCPTPPFFCSLNTSLLLLPQHPWYSYSTKTLYSFFLSIWEKIIFGRKWSQNLKVDFFLFQHIWVALCLPGEILTTHKT